MEMSTIMVLLGFMFVGLIWFIKHKHTANNKKWISNPPAKELTDKAKENQSIERRMKIIDNYFERIKDAINKGEYSITDVFIVDKETNKVYKWYFTEHLKIAFKVLRSKGFKVSHKIDFRKVYHDSLNIGTQQITPICHEEKTVITTISWEH